MFIRHQPNLIARCVDANARSIPGQNRGSQQLFPLFYYKHAYH
jgi:hypothetical protein